MKVLVPTKRVIDPYVTVQVKKDFSGVETQNVKMAMNPFDEIALEEAIRWKESGRATHITAVSIGQPQVQETLRHALALGADDAIHVDTDQNLDPFSIAQILKWVVDKNQPDIVIMGKQAIDDDANQTGQMLAGFLDWPQVTFVSEIVFHDDTRLSATREIDGGLETLNVQLPCVITTDLRLNEPRYPALPNIMKAKRKPLETIALQATGLELTQQIQCVKVTPPAERKPGKFVQNVEELVQQLRDVEKILD